MMIGDKVVMANQKQERKINFDQKEIQGPKPATGVILADVVWR